MPDIGLFEVVVITIVIGNLLVSLFSDEIKKLKKLRWALLLLLAIPMIVHEILIEKSPDFYLGKAKENLKKAQEKLEPDDPAREKVKRIQVDIEKIREYTLRRTERYNRIFEEQKSIFGFCFDRFEDARKLRKTGRYNEAIKIFNEILVDCPNFYLAHYNLGLAYEALGNLKSAELHYEKAARLETTLRTRDPSIYNTYGFLLLRLHKFEDAEKAYLKAIELDPEHPKAKTGLEAARKKVIF